MNWFLVVAILVALCGAALGDVEAEERQRPCAICPTVMRPADDRCVWQPPASCRSCGKWRCPRPKPCDLAKCAEPKCKEGERLSFEDGGCCGKCVTDCSAVSCAAIAEFCADGSPAAVPAGGCCPVCPPVPAPVPHVCNIACTRPPVCENNRVASVLPGECCPTCPAPSTDCSLVRCAAPPTCAAGERFELDVGSCCKGKCVTDCSEAVCPAIFLHCADGLPATVQPGQCCPSCPAPSVDCSLVRCAAPPTCAAGERFELDVGSCCEGKCVTDCSEAVCPAIFLQCADGLPATVQPGQCCPSCPAPVDCAAVLCALPVCEGDVEATVPAGDCCPSCPTSACPADLSCPQFRCSPGFTTIQRPGDCCPSGCYAVCGGIANIPCAAPTTCLITDTWPDATGGCVNGAQAV